MSIASNRRDFLRIVGATGLISLSGPVPGIWSRSLANEKSSSTQPAERVLVLIQLAGGNDGLNTVVPVGDPEYYKARPGLAIGKEAALSLNDHYGLHPNLSELHKLWDEGQVGIVQGIGYPQPDRSHFRSMDIWHSAQPKNETPRTGWLGRTLDSLADSSTPREAVVLGGDRLPLALTAERTIVPTVSRLEQFRLSDRGWKADGAVREQAWTTATKTAATSGSALDFVRRTAASSVDSARKLSALGDGTRSTVEYPGSGLAQKLKLVSQMLTAELPTRIFFVSLDGFDTHSQQAPGHAVLLNELSAAVGAFVADLREHKLADRVLVATFSEFGRRVAENGSLGTDHGAASMSFVVGPAVKAGFHGKDPNLTDLDDGDTKFTTDFRQFYATLLDRWLAIPSAPILGGEFAPVGYV